jgi:hypothetical protein
MDALEQLEAEIEEGKSVTNFDIAISGGKPVEGFLESKDGVLKAFDTGPIDYGVTTKEIEEIAAKSVTLTVADEKMVIATHQRAKAMRIQIEAKRKVHKEVAIDYGKRVDDGAKALKALIEPVEDSLKAMRDQAEEIKAKAKREAEEAKRLLVDSRLKQLAELEWSSNALVVADMTDEEFDDELSKAGEYFAVIRQKREAEAEAKRLADEAAAEAQRLVDLQIEKDRKELEELREEKRRLEVERDLREHEAKEKEIENAKILAEWQAKIDASGVFRDEIQKEEREAAEAKRQKELADQQAEHDRQQQILRDQFAEQQAIIDKARQDAEAEAKRVQDENDRLEREATLKQLEAEEKEQAARFEQERIAREAEQAEKNRVAAEARAAYLESIKPDAEKIRAFGAALSNWVEANLPTVEKDESKDLLCNVGSTLDEVCGVLLDFGMGSNGSMPF